MSTYAQQAERLQLSNAQSALTELEKAREAALTVRAESAQSSDNYIRATVLLHAVDTR